MAVQLYVKYPDTTNWIVLDQFQSEPIKLNFSVSNIIDPLQVSSIFSRTFRVPHTSINGPFFRAVFNVNSVSFDASRKADAYINDNGALFSVGNIRLDSIYRNEKSGDIQYEIIFYGETSDFGSKIGGGFLSEVDLSAYNHTLNYLNITNSWSNGLFGGDIVYPLCEWGYDYENGVPVQTTLAFGGANGFVGPSPPALAQNQFKPVIRAKALWDAIFEETSYTYDSTFLNSTEFTNLYVITESTARATLNVDNTFSATNGTQDITTGTCGYPVQADTEISDPNNNWNPVTGIYVARATGAHTFTFNGTQWALPPPGPGSYTFTWTLSIVDADTLVTLATTSPTSAGSGYNAPISRTFNVSLTSGQRVAFKYCVSAVTVGIITSFLTRLLNVTLRCTVAPEEVTMTSLMPNNIKKIDFMRSIINQFKLVFVPDRDIARKFEITPWKDWILQGTNRDWTAKLDGSKDMKIKPLFYGQERFQIYRYLEDADFVNLNYGLVTKQTYGQLNQESENELITGTKETVLQFAPTPLLPIGNANPNADPATDPYEYYASEFLIPHLAKDTNTERSPIQPKLRLVYYNGMILVPDATQNWKLLNDANAGVTQTRYPLVSQYSAWPPNSSTFDLSWENEAPLWNTEQTSNPAARTPYDTFNVYWKTWYDTTFDPYSRIVEANFVLEYNDIYDIKFNDYVFVIDAWYVVNKIVDYIAGQITNCKVELIKVGNSIGLTIPPSVELFTPVSLCLGFTACEAFCCNGEFGYQTYYVDGTDLLDSNFIYSDIYGSIPVTEGIYSDGTTTVGTAAGGVISTVYDTSLCDCEPAAVYSFEVCYADEEEGLCVACCCTGDTVTVYGTDPTLINNLNLYTDSGLLFPAANGNYYDDSVSASPFTAQVGGGLGQVQAIGVCTSCECNLPELYELEAEFISSEFSPAEACTETGAETLVWGDASTWATSTNVYADAFGIAAAAEGNYYVLADDSVYVVNSSGVITSVYNCSAPPLDPDAEAFLLAAGITDPTETAAVNTLVLDLKAASLWTLFDAFYPFVGGTASTCKFNLKDPQNTDAAFRITWYGGMTFSSTGILGNSSNSGGNSNLNPTTESYTQICMGVYINAGFDPVPNGDYDMGAYDGARDWMISLGFNNKTFRYANFGSGYVTPSTGTYAKALLLGQNNGTNIQMYQGTTQLASQSNNIQPQTRPLGIGCSWRNLVSESTGRGYGTAFFGGTYLTGGQITNLNTAIVNFNNTLGR